MWICRDCQKKHGDAADTCIECGKHKDEVGAQISPNVKRKIKPFHAVFLIYLFIGYLGVSIYLSLKKEEHEQNIQKEMAEIERVIDRVNQELDEEEYKKIIDIDDWDTEQVNVLFQKLWRDSIRILLGYKSRNVVSDIMKLVSKSAKDGLTDKEMYDLRQMVMSGSEECSSREKKILVFFFDMYHAPFHRRPGLDKALFIRKLKKIYLEPPSENGNHKSLPDLDLQKKFAMVFNRIAMQYLSLSDYEIMATYIKKIYNSESIEDSDKKVLSDLLLKIQKQCTADEEIIVNFSKKICLSSERDVG